MPTKRDSQPSLFDEPAAASDDGLTVDYASVGVSKSTFKAGQSERVHRWFRLTPSFGPPLVRHMLGALVAHEHEVVLDPFAGTSTTLIEAKLCGLRSFGYEINPLLHFVGETSLNWSLNTAELRDGLAEIDDRFHSLERQHGDKQPKALPYHLPSIHNVNRWWRTDVLTRLVLLRESISELSIPGLIPFFRLALTGVLVPDLTNVTLGRLQLFFIDRSEDRIEVWKTYKSHTEVMIRDVDALKQIDDAPEATLMAGDSVSFDPPPGNVRFNIIITSPPYPNRYSYVWNTRPHLYMLDFFTGKREAAQLDLATIGGTWGTATSVLAKGVLAPYNSAVESAVGSIVSDIRDRDNLMANYCMKYFNKLAEHFERLKGFLAPGARLAYVVGCSRLKKVYVETDVLLAKLLDDLDAGYRSTGIERFRKRHSGKDLHESIVYAECD